MDPSNMEYRSALNQMNMQRQTGGYRTTGRQTAGGFGFSALASTHQNRQTIQSATGMDFHLENYSEHSLDEGSTSRAASYVGLVWGDNTVTWGAGTDTDIIVAGIRALVSAINNR
jgi:hypothetical protein